MFLRLCVAIVILSTIYALPPKSNDQRCVSHCSDGGICVIEDETPRCYCLPEWSGERCDQPRDLTRKRIQTDESMKRISTRTTPCSLVPDLCVNGVCQFDSENFLFSCKCADTHFGPRCERLSPCASINYCQNGGLCIFNEKDAKLECKCTGGLTGQTCETTIEPTTMASTTTTTTTPSPLCAAFVKFCNGGSCVEVSGAPRCVCPANTNPPYCTPLATPAPPSPPPSVATPPPATPPPVIPGQSSSTAAPSGSTTPASGTPQPNKTCANNPCQNGRPCFNNGNSYYCYCGPQYTGYDCQTFAG